MKECGWRSRPVREGPLTAQPGDIRGFASLLPANDTGNQKNDRFRPDRAGKNHKAKENKREKDSKIDGFSGI